MMTRLKVWPWITNKEILANFTYSQWCMDPMSCPTQIKKETILIVVFFKDFLVGIKYQRYELLNQT